MLLRLEGATKSGAAWLGIDNREAAHGGIRQEKASSRRFRTIQVCPKDLPRDRW